MLGRGVALAFLLLLSTVSQAWASVTFENAANASAVSVTTVSNPSLQPGWRSESRPRRWADLWRGRASDRRGRQIRRRPSDARHWHLRHERQRPHRDLVSCGPVDVASEHRRRVDGKPLRRDGSRSLQWRQQDCPVINGTAATGTSTAIALTVASAAGDMTMDAVGTLSVTAPFLSAPTRTQRWLDTTQAAVKGGGSTAVGGAPVTHTWTAGSALAWASSGVCINSAVIGFEVGSFAKTTSAAPATQVIPHGLGQAPKAIILWTESRSDETFSGNTGVTYRAAASATAGNNVLTLTINKPAGTLQNDVMVAAIGVQANTRDDYRASRLDARAPKKPDTGHPECGRSVLEGRRRWRADELLIHAQCVYGLGRRHCLFRQASIRRPQSTRRPAKPPPARSIRPRPP